MGRKGPLAQVGKRLEKQHQGHTENHDRQDGAKRQPAPLLTRRMLTPETPTALQGENQARQGRDPMKPNRDFS